MEMNISKSILKSILVNKKVGTIISDKKHEKIKLWIDELKPYLEKLQQMGYIDGTWKSINIKFKIKKPISTNTISKL